MACGRQSADAFDRRWIGRPGHVAGRLTAASVRWFGRAVRRSVAIELLRAGIVANRRTVDIAPATRQAALIARRPLCREVNGMFVIIVRLLWVAAVRATGSRQPLAYVLGLHRRVLAEVRHQSVTEGSNPTKCAQPRLLAPAVRCARTRRRSHGLDEATNEGQQQVDRPGGDHDPSHAGNLRRRRSDQPDRATDSGSGWPASIS